MSFFDQGFRPFFLGASLWALLGIPLWIALFSGMVALPHVGDMEAWHAHEMIFGYGGAALAGFLLTAVPNWTGIAAPKGRQLAIIFGLWILARLANLASEAIPDIALAFLNVSAPTMVLAYVAGAIGKSGNSRNWVVVGLVGLFILCDLLMSTEAFEEYGEHGGLALLVLLITLIGGRIIPNFTRNWFRSRGREGEPAPFGLVDKVTFLLSILALVAFVLELEGPLGAMLMFAAALANLFRLSRWQGLSTTAEPLILFLHIAHLWLPVGYLLFGLSWITDAVSHSAAFHALTVGVIGSTTLIVMTRATLGHSGRALTSTPLMTTYLVALQISALVRLLYEFTGHPIALLWIVGGAWMVAYGGFLVAHWNAFFQPRLDA